MKRILSMVLAFAIIGSLVFQASAATTPKGRFDTSKRVELQFYMLGNAPRDLPTIQDEINKLALKDLNCTVKFNYTTWSDTTTKYNLLLFSGQDCDLLFTADWMNYNQYALKGAFYPLNAVVPKVAPDLYRFVPKDYWEAVKINKKIYTMPATWKEYVPEGFQYREDLRAKYNVPAITSLDTIEKYWDAIKKNEPTMAVTEFLARDWGSGGPVFDAWTMLYNLKYASDIGVTYGLMNNYKKPNVLTQYWGSTDFIKDMKIINGWAKKGFWSKSALSTKQYPDSEFENGKVSCLPNNNPGKYASSLVATSNNHPEWKVGYLPYPDVTKYVVPVHPNHNGFAVPRSSKNVERAVAFYEKMVLDKRYNYLTQYGIEGKNFNITKDGYYDQIGDTKSNGFLREGMNGWAWRNPKIQLFDKSFDTVLNLFKKFDKIATKNISGGFVEDYTPFQAERAALFQVQSQYLVPLMAGFVDDVDGFTKEFMAKAKAAGLEKIQAEYTKQWQAYCKSHNYK